MGRETVLDTFDLSGAAAAELPARGPVPLLARARNGAQQIEYRCRLDLRPPEPPGRLLLRIGGAFYETTISLDGRPLARHEGYFDPFGLDLTPHLTGGPSEILVHCETPLAAGAFRQKTALLGIFADWDCKPYPSAAYPGLPDPYRWSAPVGLWRGVSLEEAGPVVVESLTVLPHVPADPAWPRSGPGPVVASEARVQAKVVLRNLDDGPTSVEVVGEIVPCGWDGPAVPVAPAVVDLAPGATEEIELWVDVERPRLWYPWSHGEPWMYGFVLRIADGGPPRTLSTQFGIRTVEADVAPGRWDWRLNGRRIFPRGTNYIADFYLDQVTPEGLRRDLKCVRDAHLDMIRVHGHIGPPELYALCDELGILVLCDFPMQWTYAFDLPADQATAFRDQVIAQAERMVRVLGSHPSIACWFLHNEPPWTDAGAFLGGDVHDADTNHEVDLAASRRVAEIDSTRPALPASGQFDDHLYHGWYTGSWLDKQELSPAFPTEFGVQSLPNLESPFWSTVHSEWPVDGEDPSWVHAGYQPLFWVSPGVGPPSAYATLEDYIAASQAYQAFTLGFTIDQWRKGKFAPTGGYVQFLLADAWPAITWSVLDYYRLPKAGYRALAEASRPFALLVDPAPDFHIEGSHTIVYPDGAEIAFDLFAVNDDYATEGKATAAWWVEPEGPGLWAALSRRRARLFRRASSFVVPGADEGALRVGSHRVSPRQPGTYALHVQLVHRGQRIGQRTWRFRVGAPQEHIRHPRRVPGFLVRRVYVKNSLQHTQDGFTFALKNPAMPVEIDSLMRLAVDGAPVASRDADLVRGGTRRRLSTISPGAPLEVASGDRLNIVVHGRRLAPGKHEIGITAVIVGIGEVAAVVEDELH